MSYFYLYTDYIYPRGGVGQLAEKVARKAQELGVEIRLNTRVTGLDVAQCIVTDEHSGQYRYTGLVWAADLKTLYRIAQTDGLSAAVSAKIEAEKAKILAHRGADSVFSIYLGVTSRRRPSAASRVGISSTHHPVRDWAKFTPPNCAGC